MEQFMKKNPKIAAVLLLFSLTFLGTSCTSTKGSTQATSTFELALVTDSSTEDSNSFVQGSWEGVQRFAKEKNISSKFYRPREQNSEG